LSVQVFFKTLKPGLQTCDTILSFLFQPTKVAPLMHTNASMENVCWNQILSVMGKETVQMDLMKWTVVW